MATASLSSEQTDAPLDTLVRLITPERITFQYPLAGPFRRATAYLLDLGVMLLLLVLGLIVSLVLTLGTEASMGLYFAFLFALRFGYGALFEGLFNGQTPGKWITGIRVVSAEGIPITGAQAFLRNLLWAFDGIYPFAYLPALASMLLTRRFQRLGDLAAGTMVVVEQRPPRQGLARPEPSKHVDAVLPWLPGRIDAGPGLSRALSDYVKRRRQFSPARRAEMAAPLADPARRKYGLPADAPADTVVCALYHRVFLGD